MTKIIDIIIPVYRGLEATRACLESLLAASPTTAYELIVIDDQSPEPELSAYLEHLTATGAILLLRNAENLGFVATVNRGMQLHPDRDVVLLNSDTEVANNWLDRLHNCAYSQARIASVTPFSNNATICSYPVACADNLLPANTTLPQLDQCFAIANSNISVEIPTAVGFCMYIPRAAIDAIGVFNVEIFGKGYGEENDFCMRAHYAGWKHLLCADTFVYHIGKVSFRETYNPRVQEAMQLLRHHHPTYEDLIFKHIATDPVNIYRQRATLARLCVRDRPLLLFISHNRHGGTLRHIQEMINQLAASAYVLILTTTVDGSGAVEVRFTDTFKLYFQLDADFEDLFTLLKNLSLDRIHIHHTLGLPPSVLGLATRLAIPWDFTAHDYYSICPQITLIRPDNRYCEEPDVQECNTCLRLRPAPGQVTIQQWRANYADLLATAERCFTPSLDCTNRLRRYFPAAKWRTVYHESPILAPLPVSALASLPDLQVLNQVLNIVVIGALSAMKGADILEEAARDAKNRDLPLMFTLIGYAYRNLAQMPETNLRVLGTYADTDLPELLNQAAPHLIWFPALWPETYSYTLSAALRHGVPIVAPQLGAFVERLATHPSSWLLPWTWIPSAYNDFFMQLPAATTFSNNFASVNMAIDTALAADQVTSFDYQVAYLAPLSSKPVYVPPDAEAVQKILEQYTRYLTFQTNRPFAQQIRSKSLHVLAKLRISPWMRYVVRRIPAAWQTRAKNFLLRQNR